MSYEKSLEQLRSIDLSKLPNKGNFKLGYRSSFLKTPILVGRERVIVLPNGEKHRSYFCIVDLMNVIASHNEYSFAPSENYPISKNGRNINDRNYQGDEEAQAKVMKVAQNLEPNILISTTATEESTPIITLDGICVSGNNRTMSLKLAVQDNYEKFINYKEVLVRELRYGGYGFLNNLPAQLNNNSEIELNRLGRNKIKFKHPVLVRIDVDFPSYTTEEMNKFNASSKKSEAQIDRSIRIAQQLEENEKCKSQLIELISELEIVSELYKNPTSVQRFKSILLDCNLIGENDVAKYFIGNTLSESGKLMYSVILSSLVLKPKTIEISQNAGVKSATNKVVNAVIPAIKNANLQVGSLNNEINQSILLQNRMVSSGITDILIYMNQPELFEEVVELKFKPAVIIYWLNQSKMNRFKNLLKEYNSSMELNQTKDMFGSTMSPEEIFTKRFVDPLPPEVKESLTRRFKESENVDETEVELSDLTEETIREILDKFERIIKYLPSQENIDVINSLKILLNEI